MNYISKTDVGKIRKLNEDSFMNYISDNYKLFVVCDGMGGHKAGEVASKKAVETVIEYMKSSKNEDYKTNLVHAIKEANKVIYNDSVKNIEHSNMGTTIVACVICEDNAIIANVGDSRLYIYRDSNLKQITIDHSLVNDLLSSGTITEEEAFDFVQKNVITRSLGIQEDVDIDIFEEKLKDGDLVLMCTDGLTSQLNDEEIVTIIDDFDNIEEISTNLINESNDVEGIDNVTITIYLHEREEHDR